jgi:hypothetical protein
MASISKDANGNVTVQFVGGTSAAGRFGLAR